MLLYLLSIRTRQRVLELIEAQLFATNRPASNYVNSPAIVDTYARLLYTAPYTYLRTNFNTYNLRILIAPHQKKPLPIAEKPDESGTASVASPPRVAELPCASFLQVPQLYGASLLVIA